jgi:hypothetical protein
MGSQISPQTQEIFKKKKSLFPPIFFSYFYYLLIKCNKKIGGLFQKETTNSKVSRAGRSYFFGGGMINSRAIHIARSGRLLSSHCSTNQKEKKKNDKKDLLSPTQTT